MLRKRGNQPQRLLSSRPRAMGPRAKRHLHMRWGVMDAPNRWPKTWANAFPSTRRCIRFGCQRFRHNWRLTERIRLPPFPPCKLLCPSNWGKLRSLSIFPASIRCTYEERHTWEPDRAVLPQPNFRKFSVTAESFGIAGQERWRIWDWLRPTPSGAA